MEIVLRALTVFVFLWIVTRAVGRATLGELSTFELILYVTMGDLVQQAVTQQDYSVTGAFVAVGTFSLLTVALSWTQWRFPRLRPLVTGRAVVIFSHGQPDEDVMKAQRLALGDLLSAARQQGIGTRARSSTPCSRPTGRSRSSPSTRTRPAPRSSRRLAEGPDRTGSAAEDRLSGRGPPRRPAPPRRSGPARAGCPSTGSCAR